MIIDLLKKLGYSTVSESYYDKVKMWQSWYKGKVTGFHDYTLYNGSKVLHLEKYSMGMAKTVCEDWANYIFNKDTKISTGTDSVDEALLEAFKSVRFNTNINECIESAFATGTIAVVVLENDKGVDLNYIKDTTMIFPLSWDNGEIINCCFASQKVIDGKKVLYLNIHKQHGEQWLISNRFFELDKNGKPKNEIIIDGVEEQFVSDVKRYFIYEPAIMNNVDYDTPLGMSIYANAIDQLKGVDNVYDSYVNEFVLGKKRVMVAADAVRVTEDGNGKQHPIFDPNDALFYMLPNTNQMGDTLIKEIDMNLRIQEHKEGLQDMLNALSIKIGMGTKHYSFVGGAVTATEVKSTSDTLYNSMVKHETPLEEFLCGLCDSMLYLLGYPNEKVSVEFDDSVIRDQNTDLMNNLQLLQNRVLGRADVAAYWKGMDRDKAAEFIKQIDSEEIPTADGFANEVV